ncbi:MAG: 50S ribosomal protein L19 [Alphaproteobacteria bacterium]
MNLMDKLQSKIMAPKAKSIPTFKVGDTLNVHVKVQDGERSRVQKYEGICIARHNKGATSSFTVRKISFGEGVERVFPLYSPTLEKIEVVRHGDVRRAKLYYLRGLTGKAARISEKTRAADLMAAMGATAEVAEVPASE